MNRVWSELTTYQQTLRCDDPLLADIFALQSSIPSACVSSLLKPPNSQFPGIPGVNGREFNARQRTPAARSWIGKSAIVWKGNNRITHLRRVGASLSRHAENASEGRMPKDRSVAPGFEGAREEIRRRKEPGNVREIPRLPHPRRRQRSDRSRSGLLAHGRSLHSAFPPAFECAGSGFASI